MSRRLWMSAVGPLRPLNFRCAGDGAATGHPGRAQRLAEAVFAALRLPCAARVRPVAQLSVAALTVVEQARRVRARSALRARAPNPDAARRRRCALVPARVPRCETGGARPRTRHGLAGRGGGRAWAGRIGAAEERRASARARRASSSDSSHLFERSERSERSELCDGPEDRAPQGTRSAAKGKPSEPCPGPARRLARTDASMRRRTPREQRQRAASRPVHPAHFKRRGSREARWNH